MLIIQKPQQFHKEGLLDLKRWQERKLSEVALEMLLVPKPTPEVLSGSGAFPTGPVPGGGGAEAGVGVGSPMYCWWCWLWAAVACSGVPCRLLCEPLSPRLSVFWAGRYLAGNT